MISPKDGKEYGFWKDLFVPWFIYNGIPLAICLTLAAIYALATHSLNPSMALTVVYWALALNTVTALLEAVAGLDPGLAVMFLILCLICWPIGILTLVGLFVGAAFTDAEFKREKKNGTTQGEPSYVKVNPPQKMVLSCWHEEGTCCDKCNNTRLCCGRPRGGQLL